MLWQMKGRKEAQFLPAKPVNLGSYQGILVIDDVLDRLIAGSSASAV